MKKLNKKILEAIQHGLNMALDDYDFNFNEPIKPKRDVIRNENSVKNLIEFHNSVVDLGLPSGNLWCKYNLGVDPKHLKKADNWYGQYFQWGNIKPSRYYVSTTNRFVKIVKEHGSEYVKYTKYRPVYPNTYKNEIDDLTVLLPEDDAANVILGERFHIPTCKDIEELLKYTTHKWKIKYNDVEGLYGLLFKSTINGNELFIPAGGRMVGEGKGHETNEICTWTANVSDKITERAYYLYATRFQDPIRQACVREFGLTIRPIYKQ